MQAQAELASQIKASLHGGQASASWLIVGARGVGKCVFAKELTKQLTEIDASYNPNVKWLECDLTETAKKDRNYSRLCTIWMSIFSFKI